jgi:F0F1-type ATP synthase membrane subunit b/b'
MPQLVPFFFTHQIILVLLALVLLLLIFSKFILPNILSIFLSRHTLGDKMNS